MLWRARRTARLAWKSLWLHRLRSTLTALGVVFGVMSVVAMLAIGEGASYEAQQQIRRLGSRNLILQSVKPPASSSAASTTSWVISYGLTREDFSAVQETVFDADRVVPRRDVPMEMWNGGRHVTGLVIGTEPAYREVTNLILESGRFLADEDGESRKNVCVLGGAAAETLFPGEDPIGGSVRAGSDYYTVIGVVGRRGTAPASGAGASGEEDTAIFVPIQAAFERFGPLIVQRTSGGRTNERVELHRVYVSTRDDEGVDPAASTIRALMAKRHPKQDWRLTVPKELIEEAKRSRRVHTILLGCMGAISMLVGGIGIMNIMLASVTERTREIGIRRALGARKRDIVLQFLAETLVLSASGGALGLLIGIAIPGIVTKVFNVATVVTAFSLILAFSISAAVGIIFGLYPASRAASLDPVEALRHD